VKVSGLEVVVVNETVVEVLRGNVSEVVGPQVPKVKGFASCIVQSEDTSVVMVK